jgi:hypothetical protein
MDAIARSRLGIELQIEKRDQVPDRLAGQKAHERGGADVEGVWTAFEVTGAAAKLGVCFEKRGPHSQPLGQRRRRQPTDSTSDNDQIVNHAKSPRADSGKKPQRLSRRRDPDVKDR